MYDLSHLAKAEPAEVARIATEILQGIKNRGVRVRLAPALSGGPTPESRALFDCEAEAETFLRGLRGLGPDDD